MGLHSVPRTVQATADSRGWFAICGVPGDGAFDIRARVGPRATPFVQAIATARGLIIRDLALGSDGLEPVASGASKSPSAIPARPRTATLAGVVRDSAGAPMRDVQLMLPDAGVSTTTDSAGSFSMSALPSGTQPLEVAHVGFAPVDMSVNLTSGRKETISVKLAGPIPVLAKVNVEAQHRFAKLDAFNQRRLTGQGQYFTAEQIAKMGATQLSDVFRRAHEVRVVRINPNDSTTELGIVSARGQVSFRFATTGFCFPAVFIDGVLVKDGARVINDFMDPSSVAGIEVYGDATGPSEYKSGSCGTVLIWTR